MYDFTGGFDVRFKQTEGVGVGDHHGSRGLALDGGEGVQVHATVLEAWDFYNLESDIRAALAGFVPWAESGTMTFVRWLRHLEALECTERP